MCSSTDHILKVSATPTYSSVEVLTNGSSMSRLLSLRVRLSLGSHRLFYKQLQTYAPNSLEVDARLVGEKLTKFVDEDVERA